MMTSILKGDFILHNSNGKIVSMSIAKSDCYDANQPLELSMVDTSVEWDDKGYRIDTDYFDFELSTNLLKMSLLTRSLSGRE